MENFVVKYKGEVIGTVRNKRYVPNLSNAKGVFKFLNSEIENIDSINFFKNRIDNCSRFEGVDVSYSTDNYSFEPIGS
ncbi:MAG: hypothetical protein IJ809_04125 [Clostridia bacterium]|nr:hypothetical protein [Clostridia bacterium]